MVLILFGELVSLQKIVKFKPIAPLDYAYAISIGRHQI